MAVELSPRARGSYEKSKARFGQNLELYKTFKSEFGREPAHEETFCGLSIGKWVSKQRTAFKKGTLLEERVQSLLDAGFIFDPHEAVWQDFFDLYKGFKDEFDRDPSYREVYCGAKLGSWVNNQRTSFKNGTLSKARAKNFWMPVLF